MKKKLLLGICLGLGLLASAQTSPSAYVRNSVSVVAVNPTNRIKMGLQQIQFDGRFDVNEISTSEVNGIKVRSFTNSKGETIVKGIEENQLDSVILNSKIGKELISYWFNRQADGTMSITRGEERSLYNATDQDVVKSNSVQVSTMKQAYYQLIPNSYIVAINVIDDNAPISFTSMMSSIGGLGKSIKENVVRIVKNQPAPAEKVGAEAEACVYKLDIDKAFIDNIFNTMWIYDDDSPEVRKEKKALFDNMKVPLVKVAYAKGTGVDTTIYGAVANTFNVLTDKCVNKIPSWQVTTPIYQTKPIMAKIGTKEGLSNGRRYCAYKYVEDENGELQEKKVGFLRATQIADNKHVADGQSEMSRFYQISGRKMNDGMLLKESRDLRIGASVEGELGGLSLVNARVDYLLHIGNHGLSSYAIIGGGALGFGNVQVGPYSEKESHMYYNVNLGYGLGIPLSRFFQLQPFVVAGMDMTSVDLDFTYEPVTAISSSFFGKGGLRFTFTPKYPFSLYAQAEYVYVLDRDRYYDYTYKIGDTEIPGTFSFVDRMDQISPLGFSVGIRWQF